MARAASPAASRKPHSSRALRIEDLMAQASADEQAAEAVYDCLAPRLLGLLSGIVEERGAGEKILSEVLTKLWKRGRALEREGASIAAWAALEARSQAVRHRRTQSNLPPLDRLNTNPLAGSLPCLPRPQETERVDERRELLGKVLRRLPKAQTGVLEMAVFEGLTELEMAERLSQPLGVVRAELRAALRFLRHRMRAVLGTWTADI